MNREPSQQCTVYSHFIYRRRIYKEHWYFIGTVSQDVLLLFFLMNHLPLSPWNNIRVFSKFSTGIDCIVETGGKFASHVNEAANLLSVSTTSVANCHRYQWHQRRNCCQYQRHQWQMMGTISDCWHLKVSLKEKNLSMLTILPKGVQKIMKTFLIEDFFLLPPL